ncbi:MAG: MEDS domain-containing protein [Streptosporangiaceae bacterium]|nr:MEDS domain-containing protein [Streptosporangiaceae bacterium]
MTADASTQITELTTDDHACLTFGEAEELFDLTAAFVRDGLAAGLEVMWLSDVSPGQAVAELARRGIVAGPAVAAGQMTAAGCEGRLLSGQTFSAEAAVRWLTGQLEWSRRQGFPGVRIAVDMSWALRPVTGIEQLPQFEQGVATALAGSTASLLCQYDRDRFDPVTLASVAGFHTRSVAAATYHSDAVLRICRQYAPPGVRIAGEIDYQAEQPLALALAEAVRLDGDIVVNMEGLAFIDARCTLMITDAARTMAGSRVVTLRCRPEVAAGFVRLDVADLDGVRLETVR